MTCSRRRAGRKKKSLVLVEQRQVQKRRQVTPSLGAQMKLINATLLISALVLITSCNGENQRLEEPAATITTLQYVYKVGLGYGFLGKVVQVAIDGEDVITVVGTSEIEQHAQLLGTKMLVSGSLPKKDIKLQVTVDDGQPYEQPIDLSTGMFIHIYYEQEGLRIFNTRFLVQE